MDTIIRRKTLREKSCRCPACFLHVLLAGTLAWTTGAQWRPRLTCPLNRPVVLTPPTMDFARCGEALRPIIERLRVPGFDGFCLSTYALVRVPSYVTGLMMAVRQNPARSGHRARIASTGWHQSASLHPSAAGGGAARFTRHLLR